MPRCVSPHGACMLTRASCLVLVVALARPVAEAAPSNRLSFPSTGYNTVVLDPEDPGVPDNVDILEIGYQQDGTYAYFRITVVGEASFSSDRFYLYLDLDQDGLPDRRLHNTSAANAAMDHWSGSAWVNASPAWCEDPDDTPDNHIYLACLLSGINGGGFSLAAAASDQPVQDATIRSPYDDPNADDVTPGSSNPTAIDAFGFAADRAAEGVLLTWRVGVEAQIAGFNVRFLPHGSSLARRVNPALFPADGQAAYRLLDRQPAPGVYQLEVIRLNGERRIVAAEPSPEP